MSENKQFETDCNEDYHNNQYDYSILNSRYEANTERNEIIEWNKDSCNAQYVGLKRIAEQLNFKQMQLEECRKGYKKLYEENEQLKQAYTQLKHRHSLLHDVCIDAECDRDSYRKDIVSLEKENEELKEEIARQKFSKRMMRDNIKSYERAIKRLRKSYEKFDEMRVDRIRFLEKRLKKNGLSIYVNDCGDYDYQEKEDNQIKKGGLK